MSSANSSHSEPEGHNLQPKRGIWDRLLRLSGWAAGCFLTLIGLILLIIPGSYPEKLTALGLILAGAVALPPCSQRLASKVPALGGVIAPLIAAFLLVVATMVVGAGAAAIQSSLDPVATAEREQRRQARHQQREIDERREQTEAQVEARQAVAERQAAFNRFWSGVLNASRPCEEAQQNFAAIPNGRRTRTTLIAIARNGDRTCLQSLSSMQKLRVPDQLPANAVGTMTEGLEACVLATQSRGVYFESAVAMLNGDGSAARAAVLQGHAEVIQQGTQECMTKMIVGAREAGVDFPQ